MGADEDSGNTGCDCPSEAHRILFFTKGPGMGKRILGIVGSYRKGGIIDAAVSEVLAAAPVGRP